jgi:hypothetical protein
MCMYLLAVGRWGGGVVGLWGGGVVGWLGGMAKKTPDINNNEHAYDMQMWI